MYAEVIREERSREQEQCTIKMKLTIFRICCVHVIWAARALESYAGTGIRVAENACCAIDGIQEHVTYLWTH